MAQDEGAGSLQKVRTLPSSRFAAATGMTKQAVSHPELTIYPHPELTIYPHPELTIYPYPELVEGCCPGYRSPSFDRLRMRELYPELTIYPHPELVEGSFPKRSFRLSIIMVLASSTICSCQSLWNMWVFISTGGSGVSLFRWRR